MYHEEVTTHGFLKPVKVNVEFYDAKHSPLVSKLVSKGGFNL